jgi:ferredoxin
MQARWNSTATPSGAAAAGGAPPPGKVRVTFITTDGKEVKCVAPIGKTLMEVGVANKLDIEAACDGTCACSTCHCYLDKEHFDNLGKPSEDELDMLDLAIDVRPTSRLSCQVQLSADMDGLVATLPKETSNQLSA